MSGDYSRDTAFADIRVKDKKARFYQGRSITDTQLNANTDLLEAQREIALTDVIGPSGFPKSRSGFAVRANTDGGLSLTAGHMYLDGVLFENELDLAYDVTLPANIEHVAYFLGEKTEYDYKSREYIREPALGGPDTAGRSKCSGTLIVTPIADVLSFSGLASKAELLEAARLGDHIALPHCGAGDAAAKFSIDLGVPREDNACIIQENARYKGQENVNFIAEIHNPSSSGAPSFKWARQFVEARLEQNTDGDFILVGNIDGDLMSFTGGDTIEVIDAKKRESNEAGQLGTITDNGDGTWGLPAAIAAAFAGMTSPIMIKRWEFDLAAHPDGVLIGAGAAPLINGAQIEFRGDLVTGDMWRCAARVATGDLLWPPIPAPDGFVSPFNWRRCALLGIVENSGGSIVLRDELRNLFPDLTHIDATDVSFSSNKCNFGSDTSTVHHALEKICEKISSDGCTIRVRPDEFEDLDGLPYAGVAHYPTLDEVMAGLEEFLSETQKISAANRFRSDLIENINVERIAEPMRRLRHIGDQPLQPGHTMALRLAAAAASASPGRESLIGNLGSNIEGILDVAVIPPGRETLGGDTATDSTDSAGAAPSAAASAVINPFLLRRRLSLEFFPGSYNWPKGLTALFKNMSSICLRACCGGNVNITSSESLAFENCISVNVKGLNLFFTEAASQLGVRGGKHIKIREVKITRPVSGEVPLASFAAKRRIKIKDSRFRLTHVKKFDGVRLGVHIEDARAHTSFNDVQCNGFVILGEGVPTLDQDPVPNILETSKNSLLRIGRFLPFKETTPSNNTARIESCRFFGVVPGGTLLRAAETWGAGKALRGRLANRLPFRALHVQDSEFAEGYNIFLAKTVMLRDNRFSDFGENTCVPGTMLLSEGQPSRKVVNLSENNPLFTALEHILLDPDTEDNRFWAPVGIVLAEHASIHSNIGFREHTRPGSPSYPLILDLSKRDFTVNLQYEMNQTVYDMIRHNMLVFHSVYLQRLL